MIMQKILFFILICFISISQTTASTNNSLITLSGGGNVAATSSVNVSLTGLVPTASYSVVCYIDTTFPFQYVLLGSSFTENISKILSYSINGNTVQQDKLNVGHNMVIINGTFSSPTTASLVITNLDQSNAFNVNNCFGIPIQV